MRGLAEIGHANDVQVKREKLFTAMRKRGQLPPLLSGKYRPVCCGDKPGKRLTVLAPAVWQ
jgi:hypothetical protein